MKKPVELVLRSPSGDGSDLQFLSLEQAQTIRAFHRSFPMYEPTPLAHLPNTAAQLRLADLYVKDESHRFGLNAFKVLGGSYAIGTYLAQRLGKDPGLGFGVGHRLGRLRADPCPDYAGLLYDGSGSL